MRFNLILHKIFLQIFKWNFIPDNWYLINYFVNLLFTFINYTVFGRDDFLKKCFKQLLVQLPHANSIKLLLKEALQTFEIDFTRLKNMEIRPVFPSSDTHKYSESIFLMSSCMRKHNGPILDEKIDTSSSRKMLPFLNLVFLDVSILHVKLD